jgi:hypothetical protein
MRQGRSIDLKPNPPHHLQHNWPEKEKRQTCSIFAKTARLQKNISEEESNQEKLRQQLATSTPPHTSSIPLHSLGI